jgi:hypothetical protein
MNLIRVGCRVLDLDHLIYAEAISPGEVRLNVTPGHVIVLTGQESAELRVLLTRLTPPVDRPEPEPEPESWWDRPPPL